MTGPLQDEQSLRTILDIPAEKEIVAVTPLEYPDEVPTVPARRDPDLDRKVRWVEWRDMTTVLGVNGSPRKTWNTATLLEHALKGAASAGAGPLGTGPGRRT
jgi:Multimeric flavodoxin WrbA